MYRLSAHPSIHPSLGAGRGGSTPLLKWCSSSSRSSFCVLLLSITSYSFWIPLFFFSLFSLCCSSFRPPRLYKSMAEQDGRHQELPSAGRADTQKWLCWTTSMAQRLNREHAMEHTHTHTKKGYNIKRERELYAPHAAAANVRRSHDDGGGDGRGSSHIIQNCWVVRRKDKCLALYTRSVRIICETLLLDINGWMDGYVFMTGTR